MALPSDILSWFWTNQSLLLLLNAACLVEMQQILIWLDPTGARTHELPQSRRVGWPLYHRCDLILPWGYPAIYQRIQVHKWSFCCFVFHYSSIIIFNNEMDKLIYLFNNRILKYLANPLFIWIWLSGFLIDGQRQEGKGPSNHGGKSSFFLLRLSSVNIIKTKINFPQP